MSDKKVLIITYYWPPSGGVGVQRWLHFAVNLQKLGFEPVIYTPSNSQFEIKDENLLKLAQNVKVISQPIWEPFSIFHKLTGSKEKGSIQQGLTLEKPNQSLKDRLFVWLRGNLFVPDARVFWVSPSVKFLKKYIQENQIPTIITTGPPHSMHLIGLGVKSKIKNLKWIADFRDPWSEWDILQKLNTGRLAMNHHKSLERKVLKTADVIMTVSKRLGQSLEQKITKHIAVQIIMNGVASAPLNNSNDLKAEKFVIGYFGMLNELRDPESLWNALEQLCEDRPDFHSKLEIRLGGIVSESIMDRLRKSKFLNDKVMFLGYLSHDDVFMEYKKCNVLLLLLNKSDNAKWILPVKFFEYLSAFRPILTFGPIDSDLGDILIENKIGEMMSGSDLNEIKNFILANFESNYEIDESHFERLLSRHSRESQAAELATLINQL